MCNCRQYLLKPAHRQARSSKMPAVHKHMSDIPKTHTVVHTTSLILLGMVTFSEKSTLISEAFSKRSL